MSSTMKSNAYKVMRKTTHQKENGRTIWTHTQRRSTVGHNISKYAQSYQKTREVKTTIRQNIFSLHLTGRNVTISTVGQVVQKRYFHILLIGLLFGRAIWQYLLKLKVGIALSPAIPLLSFYLINKCLHFCQTGICKYVCCSVVCIKIKHTENSNSKT